MPMPRSSAPRKAKYIVNGPLNAWGVLADQKVPLEDRDKLRLIVRDQVYREMLGDLAWVQEDLVSAAIAFEARQQADVGHAFNFQVHVDQADADQLGSILYGQTTVTFNSTTVTGLNTAFTRAARRRHVLPDVRLRRSVRQDPVQGQLDPERTPAITLSSAISSATLASGSVTTTAARSRPSRHGQLELDHAHRHQRVAPDQFQVGQSVERYCRCHGHVSPVQIASISSDASATVVELRRARLSARRP